jgi:hypothetical protein
MGLLSLCVDESRQPGYRKVEGVAHRNDPLEAYGGRKGKSAIQSPSYPRSPTQDKRPLLQENGSTFPPEAGKGVPRR